MIDRRQFLGAAGAALLAPTLSACGGPQRVPVSSVPRSRFDEESTAEEVTEGLDLAGRMAVVTGCTSGIGYETMRVLAKRGAYVVGTSRSLERAAQACKSVIGKTTPVQLDLGDFDSVARCADDILTIRSPVDMLICNAGYYGGSGARQLINGVEKHFAINHLGHFILVNRLMARMYIAEQARIVTVASRTAYRNAPAEGILFDDLAMSRNYDDAMAYGHSKLANVLFSLKLGELLRGTRITSNALHPGVIDTELSRHMGAVRRMLWSAYSGIAGKTVGQGAATSCFVATHPSLGETSGRYFEDCNAVNIEGVGHMQNMAMADRLLAKSIELTADWLVEFREPRADDFSPAYRKQD